MTVSHLVSGATQKTPLRLTFSVEARFSVRVDHKLVLVEPSVPAGRTIPGVQVPTPPISTFRGQFVVQVDDDDGGLDRLQDLGVLGRKRDEVIPSFGPNVPIFSRQGPNSYTVSLGIGELDDLPESPLQITHAEPLGSDLEQSVFPQDDYVLVLRARVDFEGIARLSGDPGSVEKGRVGGSVQRFGLDGFRFQLLGRDELPEDPRSADDLGRPPGLRGTFPKAKAMEVKVVDVGNDRVPVRHVGRFVPPFGQPGFSFARPSFQSGLQGRTERRIEELLDMRGVSCQAVLVQVRLQSLEVLVEGRVETRDGEMREKVLRGVQRLRT